MKQIITLLFFILGSVILHSQDLKKTIKVDSIIDERNEIVKSHSLSDKDKEILTKQALNSLEDLGRYINVIVDKANSRETKINNIELALRLFASDTILVETTSINGKEKTKKTIKEYLKKLMYLPYKRVDITWADIYVSDQFKKGGDGLFYGIATFCQRFRAKSIKNK